MTYKECVSNKEKYIKKYRRPSIIVVKILDKHCSITVEYVLLQKKSNSIESNGNGNGNDNGNLLVIFIKKKHDLVFLIIMHIILTGMGGHECTYFIIGVE